MIVLATINDIWKLHFFWASLIFRTRFPDAVSGLKMILTFRTDRSGQIVQTQVRLLLEEQSDQGLHCSVCYSICMFLTKYLQVWPLCLDFR